MSNFVNLNFNANSNAYKNKKLYLHIINIFKLLLYNYEEPSYNFHSFSETIFNCYHF